MRKYILLQLFISALFGNISIAADSLKVCCDPPSIAIEDNSFFIEEAYNQEPGVVQHIFTGQYAWKYFKSVGLSFTQEWPIGDEHHQISFSIPFTSLLSNSSSGVGDIMLNYRYELTGRDDFAVSAPRFSIIFPTGKVEGGFGSGNLGYQVNLPVSKRWNDFLVNHFNVGFTFFPNARTKTSAGVEAKNDIYSFDIGGSAIWLVHQNFNLMFEILHSYFVEIDASGKKQKMNVTIFNPGFRYAIDINDLQIVPGLSIPLNYQSKKITPELFFYLSFEHNI